MALKKYTLFFLLLLLLASQFGCTKHAEGITGPQGPAGQNGANGAGIKPSAITGFIALYDQYGIQESSSDGATVSTLNGDTLVIATTDSSGKFSLPYLPPGNYDIHVKKNGFDSLKVFVQHSGGDEAKFIGDVRLEAHVTTKITQETLSITPFSFGNSTLNILLVNVSFDGPPSISQTLHHFTFYFSKSEAVSEQNYDTMESGNNETTGTNSYQFQYNIGNLTAAGFTYSPGDTVYVKTYVSPVPKSVTSWFDYATYKAVSYPYLGDSVVNYFVWPN